VRGTRAASDELNLDVMVRRLERLYEERSAARGIVR
jgi:hypothetical protein